MKMVNRHISEQTASNGRAKIRRSTLERLGRERLGKPRGVDLAAQEGPDHQVNGSETDVDVVFRDAAALQPAQQGDVRDAVQLKSIAMGLPTRSRGRRIRFSGAATRTVVGTSGS